MVAPADVTHDSFFKLSKQASLHSSFQGFVGLELRARKGVLQVVPKP